MLRIGICDDEDIFRKHLKDKIEHYLDEQQIMADLMEYQDGSDLVEGMEPVDILFLDVEMKIMTGIEVKDLFAKNGEDTIIIFTSSHSEYTREMIGRNVYYFLEKPVKAEEVYQVLDDVLPSFHENTQIEVKESGKIYLLDYRKIKYIIAKDQYTKIYMENEEYLLRKKMKYWKEALPETLFCEINRSVIVSFAHFVKSAGGVKLDNGEIVKFSRKRKDEIMERYKQYLRKL